MTIDDYTYRWREEWCFKGKPSQQELLYGLQKALHKNRIDPQYFAELERLLQVPKLPIYPKYGEPYTYLLWKARILQRDPIYTRPIFLLAAAVLITNFLLLMYVYFPVFKLLTSNEHYQYILWWIVSAISLFGTGRMTFNKYLKGEWLPDEAIHFLCRNVCLTIFGSIVLAGMALYNKELLLLEILIGWGLVLLIWILLYSFLKLFGRYPYHQFGKYAADLDIFPFNSHFKKREAK